jgi:hypothetical protein
MISIILIERFVLSHISNYILGNVPGSKKKTDSPVGLFGREVFRKNFLNQIILIQSFLPKSSLAS